MVESERSWYRHDGGGCGCDDDDGVGGCDDGDGVDGDDDEDKMAPRQRSELYHRQYSTVASNLDCREPHLHCHLWGRCSRRADKSSHSYNSGSDQWPCCVDSRPWR